MLTTPISSVQFSGIQSPKIPKRKSTEYMGNNSDPVFPDKRTSIQFSVDKSTHDLYLNQREQYTFYGPYAHIRRSLDYDYHCNYSKTRQWLQDSIIDKL